ncbi:MAG TPA: glycogen-binding domain-containing protein [Longimicrobiales bacterium]|nr:glycogen-binding domain-containing protein [Longimicrobiales bacterium]
MNERIHRVLDGELSRDMLSAEEFASLVELEATLAAAESIVPRHVAPDLTASVMARIETLEAQHADAAAGAGREAAERGARPASRLMAGLEWLWQPRPVAVRPAWALAAAVLTFALFAQIPEPSEPLPTAVAPAAAPAAEIYVHFRLDAPGASSVHLAGDFTDWEPAYQLHESQPGVWTAVVPLQAGVHDYAFVIDGKRWTPDPLATRVDDGFGGENSRLSLLPPEPMRV